MHAAEEMQIGLGQRIGHGFVGREHKLFDDLMAFAVLLAMGADNAAVLIEIDLHRVERQFQRAAFEASVPAASSPARASGRPARRPRPEVFPPLFRVGQIIVDLFIREAVPAADRRRNADRRPRAPSPVNSIIAVFV